MTGTDVRTTNILIVFFFERSASPCSVSSHCWMWLTLLSPCMVISLTHTSQLTHRLSESQRPYHSALMPLMRLPAIRRLRLDGFVARYHELISSQLLTTPPRTDFFTSAHNTRCTQVLSRLQELNDEVGQNQEEQLVAEWVRCRIPRTLAHRYLCM
jgi:hypothetical protein